MSKSDRQIKYAVKSTYNIYMDGNKITLSTYEIGGDIYIQLFDIMKYFDICCTWYSHESGIIIDTSKGYVQ